MMKEDVSNVVRKVTSHINALVVQVESPSPHPTQVHHSVDQVLGLDQDRESKLVVYK